VVTDQIVATWACDHTTAECLTILSEIQIACGPVARIDEYPREANLEFRGMIQRVTDPVRDAPIFLPASPLRMTVSPGRSPDHISEPGGDRDLIKDLISARSSETQKVCLRPMTRAAIAGVRVIEIGHYTTAPLSTRVLASLGAEVIKIEPPEGEATRDWPPAQDGQGIFFTYMNSDKRSMVLDLRLDSDAAVLRELLKDADILIENLKPGALSRRGFSPRALSDLNPKLIYCSVSGFGSHSLYAGRPAYDTVIQAMSGVMDAVQSNGVPVKTGISSADLMGAEFAVLALLAALAYRDRTGQGQSIDLSMQDISAWMTQTLWNEGDHSEKAAHVIPCSDGFVLIEGEEASKIAVEASSLTRSELLLQLERLQVPSAPVLTVHEMMAAEQTESRNLWFSVTEEGKTWPLMASPMRLLGTPPEVRHPMPSLGRDTAEIERSLRAHETVT
jgi:crotonobetainyl-CoA:carnitine CoA-transferase CaiB-like acyl-CoA transferase